MQNGYPFFTNLHQQCKHTVGITYLSHSDQLQPKNS